MALGIGASGILGIAREVTPNTYVAPEKYIPFKSESMKFSFDQTERDEIRNTPSISGMTMGDGKVEGSIKFPAFPDVLVYLMAASRYSVVKTGATAPYTYAYTPAPIAIPTKTLSITITRGTETSGYVGCVVAGLTFSIEDGKLMVEAKIIGTAEASQATPTPVWPTTVPFSTGMFNLQIPTATQIFDADTYEFAVEDNASANNRIKNTIGAQFVNFGQHAVSVKTARDFVNRAEFDQYKSMTAKSTTLIATNGASNSITLTMPVSIIKSYEYNLGGISDLIRASIEYAGVNNASGVSDTITIVTSENLT